MQGPGLVDNEQVISYALAILMVLAGFALAAYMAF
jgi:hypothetical protein